MSARREHRGQQPSGASSDCGEDGAAVAAVALLPRRSHRHSDCGRVRNNKGRRRDLRRKHKSTASLSLAPSLLLPPPFGALNLHPSFLPPRPQLATDLSGGSAKNNYTFSRRRTGSKKRGGSGRGRQREERVVSLSIGGQRVYQAIRGLDEDGKGDGESPFFLSFFCWGGWGQLKPQGFFLPSPLPSISLFSPPLSRLYERRRRGPFEIAHIDGRKRK